MIQIKKILIANRGEIACRIMRTAREMGIATVAVYSDADKDALFVKQADEAVCIGGTHASESYLQQDKIIAAAKLTGADAIHPGYGFLAENAAFAARCREEGIIFIGPSAEVIRVMGSKIGAKELMQKAGVPVVPGYHGAYQDFGTFKKEAVKIGYPILLKASAGGGGKGMRIVNSETELEAAMQGASREADKSFGDGTLLMEKYFPKAKHIEFQIFGDEHGHYTHLFDRECSLQRRYQKVIEESPSASLSPSLRKQMGDAAIAAARASNYTNAGTVEFIYIPPARFDPPSSLEPEGAFYFLEVNTRLQVEHPVTEMTTGLDLVHMQIETARGLPLTVSADTIQQNGHAIECRICAEDPENNFLPGTGKILYWKEPLLQNVRYDSGVETDSTVDIFYDPLLAKVIAHADSRAEATQRMISALDKTVILGLTTNKDFLKELLSNPAFVDGSFDTRLIEREYNDYKKLADAESVAASAIAAMIYDWQSRKSKELFAHSLNGWRNIAYQPQLFEINYKGEIFKIAYTYKFKNEFTVNINSRDYKVVLISIYENEMALAINDHRQFFYIAKSADKFYVQHQAHSNYIFDEVQRFIEPDALKTASDYTAPMPGEIVKVLVKQGDKVLSGKAMIVMTSMKMETTIEAHTDSEVEEVYVVEKSYVASGTVLLKMKE